MEGWVDLGSLIAARPGIEPTAAWSQVRRPNVMPPSHPLFVFQRVQQLGRVTGSKACGSGRVTGLRSELLTRFQLWCAAVSDGCCRWVWVMPSCTTTSVCVASTLSSMTWRSTASWEHLLLQRMTALLTSGTTLATSPWSVTTSYSTVTRTAYLYRCVWSGITGR